MKLEQVRRGVLRATLHAAELGTLVTAARWVADGARGDLPAEALSQLDDVLASYDREVARLHGRATSASS